MSDKAVEVVYIHLHLAQILGGQLVALEVDEHIAAQQSVVEDEIHIEMIVVESKALLARLEEEAFSQFQKEVLQFVDDSRF